MAKNVPQVFSASKAGRRSQRRGRLAEAGYTAVKGTNPPGPLAQALGRGRE